MLTLPTYPSDAQELQAGLEQSLRSLVTLPPNHTAVTVRGDYPALEALDIDLTGATLAPDWRPAKAEASGPSQRGVSVKDFALRARPMSYQGAVLHVDLSAAEVVMDYQQSAERVQLNLADAKDGQALVRIAKRDLEALLLAKAKAAAAKQGATVEAATLTLTQQGPRAVGLEMRLTAKKMIARAVVLVRGRLAIDDDLSASVSGLSSSGEGMLGGIISSFLAPKLAGLEGKRIPLAALPLGEVRLRDLEVVAQDPLLVRAAFGS